MKKNYFYILLILLELSFFKQISIMLYEHINLND